MRTGDAAEAIESKETVLWLDDLIVRLSSTINYSINACSPCSPFDLSGIAVGCNETILNTEPLTFLGASGKKNKSYVLL